MSSVSSPHHLNGCRHHQKKIFLNSNNSLQHHIRQIDAKHHDRLHNLGSTVESETKEVVVLSEPNWIVTVDVSHARYH